MTTTPHAEWGELQWQLEKQGNGLVIKFRGEIDENADFSQLCRQLEGEVVFHMGGIRRINSCGVREWVNFVRDLPRITNLIFTHCSPVTVTQLNMIYNFRGQAKVISVYAPYICDRCDREEEKLLDLQQLFPGGKIDVLPEFFCGQCGDLMELDDIPERYLAFLTD